MEQSKIENFEKGQIIIKEGDKGDKAYLINKGQVDVRKDFPDGQSIVISRLGPGQIFGEMGLFDNKPRSASVYAGTNVEVIVINKEEFADFLEETHPQVKIIVELLLNRLRQTSNLVALLKLKTTSKEADDNTDIDKDIENLDYPV